MTQKVITLLDGTEISVPSNKVVQMQTSSIIVEGGFVVPTVTIVLAEVHSIKESSDNGEEINSRG